MLIAISDLHMSSGRRDDFLSDDHLVEFLKNAGEVFDKKAEGETKEPSTLILNGDIMDVLEAPGADFRKKVKAIRNRHRDVFGALNTLAASHEVVYLRGNHDWDAFRPKNLDATRKLFPNVTVLSDGTDSTPLLGDHNDGTYCVTFKDPNTGKDVAIHVEHGNQHDTFNNFFHNAPRNKETSLGSLIVTEIVELLEVFFPNVDNIDLKGLAKEIGTRLRRITKTYELDGQSPNNSGRGFFSGIMRRARKLADGADAEKTEQAREAKLHLARMLIDAVQAVETNYAAKAHGVAPGPEPSIVVFGHTHKETSTWLGRDSLYANSGTWTTQIRPAGHDEFMETNPRSFVAINFNRSLHQNAPDAVRRYNGVI